MRLSIQVIRSWSLLTALLGMLMCALLGPLLNKWTFTWGNHTLHFIFLSPVVGLMAITSGEMAILKGQAQQNPLAQVRPVTNRQELLEMQAQVRRVLVSDTVYQYIVTLCSETRRHPGIELGLSPRGTLALAAIARASAYVQGRNYVIPKDVSDMFPYIAIHRLRLSSEAKMNRWKVEDILQQIVERVEAPLPERMKFRG